MEVIKEGNDLYKQINEKGLYKVLEEENFINGSLVDISTRLTDEEKQQILEIIREESGSDEIDDFYTIREILDDLDNRAEELGMPNCLMPYFDAIAMLKDQIISGEIAYTNLVKDGKNFLVFYYTR